ncbi:unnamed protein product [Angiostrongylus costaricensis]|uniref:TSP1_spondin domain-containing protein n=1 Tax=Angiostrongylus costaricensis TaxID=334426 RepID=A0A0R3PH82_ANGCS|nr:unnamed protein product [Angiostrongylus costaricensis]
MCLPLGCGNEAVVASESDCPNRNPTHGWSEVKEQRPCLPRLPMCQLLSEWGEWGPCESECGQGEQKRKRLCLSNDCDEETEERRPCWNPGKRCSSGTWGDWLPCSVSCGIGFQIRERLCDGILCPTANKQARTCNEQPCPSKSLNDYEWKEWNEWSECSQTCGDGLQYKERLCKRGHCPPSEFIERRRCINSPCPMWDDWNEWSECPSCSRLHSRTRTRTCLSNSKEENATCDGPLRMEEPCDQHCSANGSDNNRPDIELVTAKGRRRVIAHGGRIVPVVDDKWGEWTKWTECSHTCGGGTRRRARICIGNKCPSQPLESVKEICNQNSCPSGISFSRVVLLLVAGRTGLNGRSAQRTVKERGIRFAIECALNHFQSIEVCTVWVTLLINVRAHHQHRVVIELMVTGVIGVSGASATTHARMFKEVVQG